QEMSCAIFNRELDRQFEAGDSTPSQAARRHLEQCKQCRLLYKWAASAPGYPQPSLETYDRIQMALESSLKPVSRWPSTYALAAQFFAVFVFFMLPAIAMMGVAGLRQMTLLQTVATSAAMILGAGLLSLSLAWQLTPGSRQPYRGTSLVAVLALGLLV